MKICKKCTKEKELSNFRKDSKGLDGYRVTCKECEYGHIPHTKYVDQKECTKCHEIKDINRFAFKNADHLYRYSVCRTCRERERYPKRKEKLSRKISIKKNDIKKKYKLNYDVYLQMIKDQDNKCLICGIIPEKGLVVDHCHTSTKVRGLLCGQCNSGLGMFKDNIISMQKAIDYINIHTC